MLTGGTSPGAARATYDERALALALAGIGFALSAIFALRDPDGIVQFDDLTHYLYARWAWTWPAYLLDDWGRPGFTALYFLPAGLSWAACRILSCALSAGAALAAFEIARTLGLRRAWLVVPLVFAQPLFFQLSQTTLTETPMAFYLTLSVMLAQKGRWTTSAAILSPAFVTRHEAIMFLPLWFFFAWRDRVALWRLWPLLWAPLAVNFLAPLAGVNAPIARLFAPTPSTQYGRGGWLTFFCRALEAWGPGITILAMVGFVPTVRFRNGALVAATIALYFAAQTIIRALGLYDSGGYARFLVPLSPLVAVAALAGWNELWSAEKTHWRRSALIAANAMVLLWIALERQLVLYAARRDLAAEIPELHKAVAVVRWSALALALLAVMIAALSTSRAVRRWPRALMPSALAALTLLAVYALCHPLRKPPEAAIIADARAWLAAQNLGDREIISANVWLDYVTNRRLPPDRPTVREQIAKAPLGTLVAWERQFAASPDHGLELSEFLKSPSFRLLHQTSPRPFQRDPYLTIFEKTSPWDGGLSEPGTPVPAERPFTPP
ncbi:MAG TPA: hypothetical protein VJZ71_16110 [Phycisphaerae bacterium]|nr:hypothetical protein [Phycisphaerae bacterium]